MLQRLVKGIRNLYEKDQEVMDKEASVGHSVDSDSDSPPESYGITKEEHQHSQIAITTSTENQTIEVDQEAESQVDSVVLEEIKQVVTVTETVEKHVGKAEKSVEDPPTIRKVQSNDPYAGYTTGQTKRRKTKKRKKLVEESVAANVEYNGVIVRYTEKTMPEDMSKYVNSRIY